MFYEIMRPTPIVAASRIYRRNAMLTSSAISALALASLFTPQDAHAANCTTSGPAGTYVNSCIGSSPTPPPTPGTGEYGRPAFPGETPAIQPISISGDYNGASGTGTVQIASQGGNGSAGGAGGGINDPLTDYTNGAPGGTGGNGGTLTATISSGKILDGGNATSPVSIIANGGQGGEGGMPGSRGTGGGGGRGGSGGTIHFTLGQAAQVISTKPGVAAIDIQAFGAQGGDAAQAQTHHEHAYGQTGGDGGAGGTIGDASAPITIMGIIQSAGSGVVAHSVGAKAGRGGGAGNDSGEATGGNGGTGGGAGGFNIILASGGSISATGSSTPGQGTTIGDSALSITFSEVTAGIYALSTGGEGGDGPWRTAALLVAKAAMAAARTATRRCSSPISAARSTRPAICRSACWHRAWAAMAATAPMAAACSSPRAGPASRAATAAP